MSFSSEVKKELFQKTNDGRHCNIAELSSAISTCATLDNGVLKIQTENAMAAKRIQTLLHDTFAPSIEQSDKLNAFFLYDRADIKKILLATGVAGENEPISIGKRVNPLIVSSACCKKAYLRAAFYISGSLSNPEKIYHAEFAVTCKEFAVSVMELINSFDLSSKILMRKDHYIVYLKDSDQIADLLKIMEARDALMELENVRILKDVRNDINRKANFELANFDKTVSASAKQVLDIRYIMETKGLSYLSEPLQEVASLRLTYTEASLKELSEMLTSTVSKSGINHRFRKISEIAEELRGGLI